jgi:hypothetical protein
MEANSPSRASHSRTLDRVKMRIGTFSRGYDRSAQAALRSQHSFDMISRRHTQNELIASSREG